ncbi:unnamed protein product [Spirodela intermedia]|uniref:Uncharacterized protein n=1 Tax=Spirodela intermedia TaxID=51605 RepID=A0A7I8JTM7_SPIIN|nr:unnamed protein product [Spirodela intermedia]CAA6673449.1 unnamed protein product [Spirodela intermedia]
MTTVIVFVYFFLIHLIAGTVSSVSSPPSTMPKVGEETGIWDRHQMDVRLSLRRVLSERKTRENTTCDREPRVCEIAGSPGRDCCQKRCVNQKTDLLNCGGCEKRCTFGQVCCQGKCTNILFDWRNCGACNRRCRRPNSCRFGMCDYA